MTVASRSSPRAIGLAVALLAGTAGAVQYDTRIEVDDADDIHELYAGGLITDEARDALLELLDQGVELDTADRDELYELPNLTYEQVDAIIEYRGQTGHIEDPADLVRAGAIPADLLPQIAPFLILGADERGRIPVSGRVRLGATYAPTDSLAPPAFLRARAKGFGLNAAVLLVTMREQIGNVGYDPSRLALVADRPVYSMRAPKFFLEWKTPDYHVVGGTFRAGFGQRLTLDNTSRTQPVGIYPDDQMYFIVTQSRYCLSGGYEPTSGGLCPEDRNVYETADYDWTDRFRGAAAQAKNIGLGELGKLSVTGLASSQRHSIYQYAIFNRDQCTDPALDTTACKAPALLSRADPSQKLSYQTLPDLYDEVVVGGNSRVELGFHRHLGVTGYWANDLWRVEGVRLDFQEWARRPYAGPYGAVGLDAAWNLDRLTLFAEVARSFDSMPGGGGGLGAIQRTVLSGKRQELELSLRYYDRGFANSFSRPIAASDVLDGFRARNEAGARLQYQGSRLGDFRARGTLDAWVWPQDGVAKGTAGRANFDAKAFASFEGWNFFEPGLGVQYRNLDLGENGFGECYMEASDDEGEEFAAPCSGEKYRGEALITLRPAKRVSLRLESSYTLATSSTYPDQFRRDGRLAAGVLAWPLDSLRVKARLRWLDEDIASPTRWETSLWGYLELALKLGRHTHWKARYDAYAYLDQRESTQKRYPNPEHRFWMEVEARF